MTPFAKLVRQQKPTKLERAEGGKSGALVATYKSGVKAVIKLVKAKSPDGKTYQREIALATHPYREVAFYELAKILEWQDLVPETVLIELDGVPASAQVFMPAMKLSKIDPKLKTEEDEETWRRRLVHVCHMAQRSSWTRLVLLDLIAGQRDRHLNNVGVMLHFGQQRPTLKVVAWDNAVTFGLTFRYYHNVFHKFLFADSFNLAPYWARLENVKRADLEVLARRELLHDDEVEHAYQRLQFLLEYPYRLPFSILSRGRSRSKEFPAYRRFFMPLSAPGENSWPSSEAVPA